MNKLLKIIFSVLGLFSGAAVGTFLTGPIVASFSLLLLANVINGSNIQTSGQILASIGMGIIIISAVSGLLIGFVLSNKIDNANPQKRRNLIFLYAAIFTVPILLFSFRLIRIEDSRKSIRIIEENKITDLFVTADTESIIVDLVSNSDNKINLTIQDSVYENVKYEESYEVSQDGNSIRISKDKIKNLYIEQGLVEKFSYDVYFPATLEIEVSMSNSNMSYKRKLKTQLIF